MHLIIILAFVVLSGCVTASASKPAVAEPSQTAAPQKIVPLEPVTSPLTLDDPVLSKEEVEKKRLEIAAAYKDFLAQGNKCDRAFWTRYEFGGYFQELADENKITPYEVVFGDAYARRNISRALWNEAKTNFFNYWITHMPRPAQAMMGQKFPTEQEYDANQKAVFNASIKRDYECYRKLK